MLYAALLVAFISLWMAWPGLRPMEGASPVWYALRWVLFGILTGSALFLVYLLLGLRG
ncbi:hypothetical protein [Hymenobacter persicinus]|uniref:hypothetical protein n=1 Tax=Hymenobacter persicinus TaxID=2025506 RepID=UPI0013EA439F|nr:hypothetical protein [Hymenobacter persicinus]